MFLASELCPHAAATYALNFGQPPAGDITEVRDEDVPLYFTDPAQLGAYFMSLEEDNLFQMQRSQETEVMFEDVMKQDSSSNSKKLTLLL